MVSTDRFVVTCEHGGNRIPAQYAELFRRARGSLDGHRGYDIGALALARGIARGLRAPLYAATISRLLIDLNRSPGHRAWYSDITRALPSAERARIRQRYYDPYRARVESAIARACRHGRVVHLAVHSFTPRYRRRVRRVDIGLLYDPARPAEREFSTALQRALRLALPGMVIRRNYPYRGSADGFTTYLRRRFPASRYLGIELEVNQRHLLQGGRIPARLTRALVTAIALRAHSK